MKRNEKSLYKIMNVAFLLTAAMFLFGILRISLETKWQVTGDALQIAGSIVFCILFFVILHAAKCLRFYLVLMEQKIEFKRFVKIYLKTTFVNFVLPMKSGELFRIYCFAHETRNVQMGFISVILDRIFDTCVLLLFLVPYDVFVSRRISAVTIILSLVVLTVVLGSIFLYSSYGYLNRFLIINGTSKRTIYLLQLLENLKMCYDDMAGLLKGRCMLILIFSCIGWIFEFLFLKTMAGVLAIEFKTAQFAEYIGGIFESGTGILKNGYVAVSALALLFSMLLFYLFKKDGGQKNA